MKKLFYPALFHKAEEGGFWITFPDFPECMTQGENMQDAYEMAWDALGLAVVSRIENREALPPVTEPYAVTLDPDTFCVIVPFDLISYQKKHNSKAVKKTLSIPEWLNEAATDRNVNFSQVLQDALLEKRPFAVWCSGRPFYGLEVTEKPRMGDGLGRTDEKTPYSYWIFQQL